jgi:hypothetical protein
MSLSYKGRDRLIWLGAVLAPVAAVQVVRLFELEPVRAASAAGDVVLAAPSVRPVAKPTSAQEKALAWIAKQDRTRIRDPFAPAPVAAPEPTVFVQPLDTPESEPEMREIAPAMELTGVMDGQRGPLASINRKIYRLGDEVVAGWTLESVDAREKIVVLRSSLGNMLELRIKPVSAVP